MPCLNYTMATGYKWSKSFGSGHCFHLLLLTCMINSRFRFLLHDVYAHNSLVCESNICHIILVKDTLHTYYRRMCLWTFVPLSLVYMYTQAHTHTHTQARSHIAIYQFPYVPFEIRTLRYIILNNQNQPNHIFFTLAYLSMVSFSLY